MDRNGDHMAVDPVSPAANYKEKEQSLEAQPARPRRNSLEDLDSSRPRKRLATMGSTTPQGSSPTTDKEDSMDRSPRSTTLSPPSSSSTTTAMTSTGNSTATAAVTTTTITTTATTATTTTTTTTTAAATLASQAMDQTSDTPPSSPQSQRNIAGKSLAGEEPKILSSIEAIRSKTPDEAPARPAKPVELDEAPQIDCQEPIIISVEPEGDSYLSTSDITSAPESPWQDGSYLRSPEVEELDGMEEDEILADSITVVGEELERPTFDHETISQMAREFALAPNPRHQIKNLEMLLSKFLDSSQQEQIASMRATAQFYPLPDLVNNLLKRREPFSREFVLGKNQLGRRMLAKLFIRFLQFTVRCTELEAQLLQTNLATGAISNNLMNISAEILMAHDDLFLQLQKDYHIILSSEIAINLPEILENQNALQAIKEFLQGIYLHIFEKPKSLGYMIGPLLFLQELLKSLLMKDWIHDIDQEKRYLYTIELCKIAVDIITLVEATTRKLLESQGQAVNIKDYAWITDILGACAFYLSYSLSDSGLELLPPASRNNFHSLAPHDRGEYSQALFKLPMFTTMIKSNRMDCRILGITKLADSLHHIWKRLNSDTASSAALRCMADDIRRSRIIEYLVGPESHPELVRLSHHIGSFLVVNHCLTPDILQAIWQPLIDDKDPRIVQSITKIVVEFVMHMPYGHLVDLCRRAIEIPFSSYDLTMLDFVIHILHMTWKKYEEGIRSDDQTYHSYIDRAPYDLIIALIRKAWTLEEEGQTCKGVSPSSISDKMSQELTNITQYAPPPGVQKKIYLECVADIKSKNASATGSIIVLWALLQRRPKTLASDECFEFYLQAEELECVDALIEDIASFVESHRHRDLGLRARKLKARLDLLHWILIRCPESLDASQIERVCDYLVGEKALGHQERDMAFSNFAQLANPNPFLDHFFLNFYPNLNPLYLSLSCLEACKRWVEHANRVPAEISANEVVLLKGMEQVWKVILTALDKHIAFEATHFLIKMYLESPSVTQNSLHIIYATHCNLVESCIQELTSCAAVFKVLDGKQLECDQQMILDIPELDLTEKQRKFERAILVLDELLKGYRARPMFPPGTKHQSGIRGIMGSPIMITLRCYYLGAPMPVVNIQLGLHDKVEELHNQITKILGSSEYRSILGGRELHLYKDAQKTLSELGFSGPLSLLITKRPSENDTSEPTMKAVLNSVEAEILKHFDTLYGMLDFREPQGHMIYDLLRQFPPQPRAQAILMSEDVPYEDVIPSAAPYRCLYLFNAMRLWLVEYSEKEQPERFIKRIVGSIVSFLLKNDISVKTPVELKLQVLNEAIGVINKCLEGLSGTADWSDLIGECFCNGAGLVEHMIFIWESCLQPQNASFEPSGFLGVNALILLFEASKYNSSIWVIFTESKECLQALERMLLYDHREFIRRSVQQLLYKTFSSTTSFGDFSCVDVAWYFWSISVNMLQQASDYPEQTIQLFEIAKFLLEYLGKFSEIDSTKLNRYFLDWIVILQLHKVKQVIGRPTEDYIVIGYTLLLSTCKKYLGENFSCPDLPTRIVSIFRNLLFTPITQPGIHDEVLEETLPCMGPETREKLYLLLTELAEDENVNSTLIDLLTELIPPDQPSILSDIIWNFDRTQLPISGAGRVGLRNLSNTCYLNSLITQLFMNVPFRSFILNLNVDDPVDTQNLLHAIKTLFARMQNGLVKTADTRDLAQAIKDYENNEIDVTVQMDVDEFFNLLFDRIESQIGSVEEKNTFRSFYGGKLVQQVKSKECPHISEREEPFSAIQCDIKGKTCLQDSLKAYVEGEIMEGDNKYSCTSCNKHVDAVKRACLKDIPDHLIFHLKRFEFDLNTMVRSKINDSFEFPDCIDMRPYTIQYISDSDPCTTPDAFELVGVLVHNGTAESGHYYSYIKDRHEFTEQHNPIWFEFNDSEVSSFDPSVISMQCYGGNDFLGPSKELGQPIAFQKSYSAYMLFYERMKPLQFTLETPISKKIPIDRDLAIDILQDNERSVQKFCLFDGGYLTLTNNLLHQAHTLWANNPTPHREIMKQQALQLSLRTYEQIGARIKDSREAESLFITIRDLVTSDVSLGCARYFLRWVCSFRDSYRLLLLRCIVPRIRENFASLVVTALACFRPKFEEADVADDEDSAQFSEYYGLLDNVLKATLSLWDYLNVLFKPWDEYFLVLKGIAGMGRRERVVLLRNHILKRCFWLFMPESLDREVRTYHQNVIKVLEKSPKRINYRNLLEFMELLLEPIHVGLGPCLSEEHRDFDPEMNAYPLTQDEKYFLQLTSEKEKTRVNAFFFKQVSSSINSDCTQRLIKRILSMDNEPFPLQRLIESLKAALMHGISLDPANEAGPYLEALVAYCSTVRIPLHVQEIVTRVAEEVATIGVNGGHEHFRFFYELWKLRNPYIKPATFLANLVMDTVHQWAPPLLCFPDPEVRKITEQLLKEKIFQPRHDSNTLDGRKRIIERAIESLPEACFRFAEDKFLKNKDLCGAADDKSFDNLIRILELCPKNDEEESPGYSSKLDGLRILLSRHLEELDQGSENWAASDIGSDSNNELGDDDSV